MLTNKPRLESGLTVNETVRLYPQTIPVFNEFGIDSCCGGAVSISVAAERDAADLAALMRRLEEAVASQ